MHACLYDILVAARRRAAIGIQNLLSGCELKDASQERFAQLGNAVRNLDDATRPIRQDAGALTVRYHDMPGVFPHFWKQRVVQMQIVSCDCCCVTFMLILQSFSSFAAPNYHLNHPCFVLPSVLNNCKGKKTLQRKKNTFSRQG